MLKKVKVEPGTEAGREDGEGKDAMDVDGGGAFVKKEDDSMVFTSTTEFTSRLEVRVRPSGVRGARRGSFVVVRWCKMTASFAITTWTGSYLYLLKIVNICIILRD